MTSTQAILMVARDAAEQGREADRVAMLDELVDVAHVRVTASGARDASFQRSLRPSRGLLTTRRIAWLMWLPSQTTAWKDWIDVLVTRDLAPGDDPVRFPDQGWLPPGILPNIDYQVIHADADRVTLGVVQGNVRIPS